MEDNLDLKERIEKIFASYDYAWIPLILCGALCMWLGIKSWFFYDGSDIVPEKVSSNEICVTNKVEFFEAGNDIYIRYDKDVFSLPKDKCGTFCINEEKKEDFGIIVTTKIVLFYDSTDVFKRTEETSVDTRKQQLKTRYKTKSVLARLSSFITIPIGLGSLILGILLLIYYILDVSQESKKTNRNDEEDNVDETDYDER